jgi:serine protease inhibitor
MTKRQNNREVRFRKINLQFLIETLTHIYDAGADYVDIVGTQDDVQDTINIIVQEEYMTEEPIEEEEDIPDDDIPTKLSDEDINNLIDE